MCTDSRSEQKVHLAGTREQIELARALIESHGLYDQCNRHTENNHQLSASTVIATEVSH